MADSSTMLRVSLGSSLVGYLRRKGNISWFAFDDRYLANPRRPVLGLRFEEDLQAPTRANMELPQWFSNLLPEGLLREWIASDRGVSSDREFELLAQVGRDLPGAVVIEEVDADGLEIGGVQYGQADDGGADVDEDMAWRFSLAGVGIKFSMLQKDDKFTCPASGSGGEWIVKLPDPVFPDVPRNEHAMMLLAREVGIDVPEVRLVHRDELDGVPRTAWRSSEDWAYAVRRFDRRRDGTRVHTEDLAQVRGFYPRDKYSGNFETIAGLLYRGYDLPSLLEFVRRLALFVLVGNGDAHLKNWSVIYEDPRSPRISPAYDIVATEVYRPDGNREENLGLKLAGSRRFDRVRMDGFRRLEEILGVEGAHLDDVVAGVVGACSRSWPEIRIQSELSPVISDFVSKSIEKRSRQLLEI